MPSPEDFAGPDPVHFMESDVTRLAREFAIQRVEPMPMLRDYRAESVEYLESIGESIRRAQEAKSAKGYVKRLMKRMREFEKRLDPKLEIGVQLVTFGPAVTIYVTAIGYMEPSLMVFKGQTQDGQPVELVQNVNVISYLLTALPRIDPDKPRRRIGFLRDEGEEKE
jgi:hypothetical protein